MTWETPRIGIRPNGAWLNPSVKYLEMVRQEGGKFRFHFPYFSPAWGFDVERHGTPGVIQGALSRAEFKLCYPKLITLHSPRTWYTTCANQLLLSREHIGKLGHWNPGSKIPDRYNRTVCATESQIRNGIIHRIYEGWRPIAEFEIPGTDAPKRGTKEERLRVFLHGIDFPNVYIELRTMQ